MGSIDNMPPVTDDIVSRLPYVVPTDFPLSEKLLPSALSSSALPAGFPQSIQSPQTWTADDIQGSSAQWMLELAPNEAMEVEVAAREFIVPHVLNATSVINVVATYIDEQSISNGTFLDPIQCAATRPLHSTHAQKLILAASKRPMKDINRASFPLSSSLSSRLDTISEACYFGQGFCVLRGLEARKRTEEENAVIFAGVSAHVATERGFQDHDKKHILAHLFKKHRKHESQYIPPSFSSEPIAFHTDHGDIVALYYASTVSQGGRTQLASSEHVYNELAARRPNLLRVLADDWFLDEYYGDPNSPAKHLPLLHKYGNDKITFQFSRLPFSQYLGTRARKHDIPPLTDLQIEALDSLQALASKISFSVPTVPGDILYFNNVSLLHARESYNDTATSDMPPEEHDRHLLRLWLLDPERTSKLSPPLQKIWDDIYIRNGRPEIWCIKASEAFAMNADKNG